MTPVILQGARVVIREQGDHHRGHTGVVVSEKQQSVSEVEIGPCRHYYHNSHLQVLSAPDTITCNGFCDTDRVVWTLGPAYGASRGPGAIQGFIRYGGVLYANVRFDHPGLDDEDIPLNQLVREV